jgi:hypothetical protein
MEEELSKYIELDLSTASKDVIELFLDETDDPVVFSEVFKANSKRLEILRILYEHPHTPEDVRAEAAKALSLPVKTSTEIEAIKRKDLAHKAARSREIHTESLMMRVQKLTVSERIRLAMKGNRDIRSILLKDTNKEVILSVLENPKISDSEIEMIARSRSVREEALRTISRNREWMKNYNIVLALVSNPKTPAGVAMGFVSSLKTRDLQILEKNKNVAEAVRSAAKRLFSMRKRF